MTTTMRLYKMHLKEYLRATATSGDYNFILKRIEMFVMRLSFSYANNIKLFGTNIFLSTRWHLRKTFFTPNLRTILYSKVLQYSFKTHTYCETEQI